MGAKKGMFKLFVWVKETIWLWWIPDHYGIKLCSHCIKNTFGDKNLVHCCFIETYKKKRRSLPKNMEYFSVICCLVQRRVLNSCMHFFLFLLSPADFGLLILYSVSSSCFISDFSVFRLSLHCLLTHHFQLISVTGALILSLLCFQTFPTLFRMMPPTLSLNF